MTDGEGEAGERLEFGYCFDVGRSLDYLHLVNVLHMANDYVGFYSCISAGLPIPIYSTAVADAAN